MTSSFKAVRSGDLLSAQSAKALHRLINTKSSVQLTAAAVTAAETLLTLGMTPIVGVVSLDVELEGVLGTGESITYTISRLRGGGFTTVASFTVDDTSAAGTNDGSSGIVASVYLEAGDVLHLTRGYVSGGGPTAPANTVTIQVE